MPNSFKFINKLSQLTDVNTTGKIDSDAIIYNEETHKWESLNNPGEVLLHGVISGGIISRVSSLTISVQSGIGKLVDTNLIKKVEWATTQFTLSPNLLYVIYIDINGTINVTSSIPTSNYLNSIFSFI